MKVHINGQEKNLPQNATVLHVLDVLNIPHDRQGIAVAVQGAVVPRSTWTSQHIQDGDAIEVVTAAQGG